MYPAVLKHYSLFIIILFYLLVITACGGGGEVGGQTQSQTNTISIATLDTLTTLQTPITVVDLDGYRTVVWKNASGASVNYKMSRYSTTSWDSPSPIFSSSFPVSAFDVYATAQGNLIAAWAQSSSISFDGGTVYTSYYSPTDGWTTPAEIVAYDSYVTEIQVLDDGTGNGLVVWTQREGPSFGPYNLWSSQKTPTTVWTAPDARESDTYDVAKINLGIDNNGNQTVIWHQGSSIYYARYTNSWTGRLTLSATGVDPHAGFASNGDIIAAWHQAGLLYLRRFTISAGWDTAQAYTTATNSIKAGPFVSVNDSGDALVAWQFNGGSPNWDPLKAMRYSDGSGWGNIADVDDSVFFDDINNVSLTNNNDGVIVRRNGNTSLVTYNYQNDTGWSTEQSLHAVADPDVLYNPSVAVNTSGEGVIAWTEKIGADYLIRAQLQD